MNIGLQEFDQLVMAHLIELLRQHRKKLPTEIGVTGVRRPYFDSPVTIYLDAVTPIPPVNCEAVFTEINAELKGAFERHELYFGLSIAVPHKYLNYAHYLEDRLTQQLDNAKYRKIRLKEDDNG